MILTARIWKPKNTGTVSWRIFLWKWIGSKSWSGKTMRKMWRCEEAKRSSHRLRHPRVYCDLCVVQQSRVPLTNIFFVERYTYMYTCTHVHIHVQYSVLYKIWKLKIPGTRYQQCELFYPSVYYCCFKHTYMNVYLYLAVYTHIHIHVCIYVTCGLSNSTVFSPSLVCISISFYTHTNIV